MTQTTEDRTRVGDPVRFDQGTDRRWWWPIAALAVAALVIGVFAGRLTAPSDSTDDPAQPTRTATAGEVLEPGALLGGIGGAERYPTGDDDVDRMNFAWPGQELAAPEPSTGEAVGWQWELCDVPPEPDPEDEDAAEEPPPLECRAVPEATEERWASPATNRTRLVRVIVTVDLGDDVLVQAATDPIAAVDWPDNITPGEPPPAGFPDQPPAR